MLKRMHFPDEALFEASRVMPLFIFSGHRVSVGDLFTFLFTPYPIAFPIYSKDEKLCEASIAILL